MPTTAVSDSWLKTLIDCELSPGELAEHLIALGVEIDRITDTRSTLVPFVVAEVLSATFHPNADKLQLCEVDYGDGRRANVVCGAPNVAAGQKVAFAPVGTTMPDGSLTIERRKIRGEYSEGMICSERELGLGDSHEGILVLDPEHETGTSIGDLLGDVVYEVEVTPNRGDCLGHLGIAREIRAVTGNEIRMPDAIPNTVDAKVGGVLTIEIDDPQGCSRYIARVVRGVTVGESPEWLRRRLKAIGIRPINNVVDVASYVMFECGQPLHAFDYDKVDGRAIGVRRSRPGEKFVTLDDREREIPEGTVLITDAEKPIAIAGIMGGANSEIDSSSTNVLIESAWFDPSLIRASARKLGLSTDASYRFERGADPGILQWAADRAATLIQTVAGGEVLDGSVDVIAHGHEPVDIDLRYERVDAILGTVVPPERQVEILERLGFGLLEPTDEGVGIRVPSWRSDVTSEIDLVEEVGRVYGLDRIPEKTSVGPLRIRHPEPVWELARSLRDYLIASGFSEIVAQYQTDPESAERYASGGAVELLNALGRESSRMRSSLLPGLAQIVSRNQRHGRRDLRLFEIGKTFARSSRRGLPIEGIRESEEVAVLLTGAAEPVSWDTSDREVDIFDAKGAVSRLVRTLGAGDPEYRQEIDVAWGFGAPALSVHVAGVEFGRIGPLDSWLRERYEIEGNPVIFVADLDRMVSLPRPVPRYTPPNRFPVVTRDLSLLVPSHTRHEAVVGAIRGSGSELLRSVDLFDVWVGDPDTTSGPDSGEKSMSYRLRFASSERTLQDSEVEQEIERIVERLAAEAGARLRS